MNDCSRKHAIEVASVAALVAAVMLVAVTPALALAPPVEPVYRFYNRGAGTHFYTASAVEKAHVEVTWSSTLAYEGIAWNAPLESVEADSLAGSVPTPLYRFYNVRKGSHFYTISDTEKAYVQAHYASIYTYEGTAFRAFTGNPYADPWVLPVYRFYNLVNGTHFYTISEVEKASVIANYPSIYRFEGVAFWTWSIFPASG